MIQLAVNQCRNATLQPGIQYFQQKSIGIRNYLAVIRRTKFDGALEKIFISK